MNHKWNSNTCVNCGIKREKKTMSLLMAITNSPPYNHYKRERLWHYGVAGFKRPECKKNNRLI